MRFFLYPPQRCSWKKKQQKAMGLLTFSYQMSDKLIAGCGRIPDSRSKKVWLSANNKKNEVDAKKKV